jgi:ATP-dependent Clp protease adaptor protein ClpS
MAHDNGKTAIGTRTSTMTGTLAAPVKPKMLPPYKVILHNDDKNDMEHVIESIVMLTTLNKDMAVDRTVEAHKSGCALLLVTHRERAELYAEQFQSRGLTVTIEPDE